MRYDEWAPLYEQIRRTFEFDMEGERRSAARLTDLIPGASAADSLRAMRDRLLGRTVVVVGLAPSAGVPPLWQVQAPGDRTALVAADGATERCLAAGLVPEVIVTDLDGPVPSEVAAQARGAHVAVHAHGDNLPALERWVPEFGAPVHGSWAGPPTEQLFDVGGFTDGDRAAYLAVHCGARRVLLWGFDFVHVEESDVAAQRRKREKLRWAARALQWLVDRSTVPVLSWRRDGSLVPYGAVGEGVSTQ
ncbi:MAG: DUF115 domain-containing protein [Thermoplasmata archaeon]|nr:DUF115 domain-containing protein [Thermoplasmata archaeon]